MHQQALWDHMTITDGMLSVPLSIQSAEDLAAWERWREAFSHEINTFAEGNLNPHDQDVALDSGAIRVHNVDPTTTRTLTAQSGSLAR